MIRILMPPQRRGQFKYANVDRLTRRAARVTIQVVAGRQAAIQSGCSQLKPLLDAELAKYRNIPASLGTCSKWSAREYEELQRLRAFERRVHRIKDLAPEIVEDIQGAKMNAAHIPLNALLDESPKEK